MLRELKIDTVRFAFVFPTNLKSYIVRSSISKFTEIYPNDNCMRKNIDSCNISLDDTSEPEEPVSTAMTTTSIRSEDNSNTTQESIGSTAISMSVEYNETWHDTNEEYDSWHDAIETMDNYQEWVDPPTTDKTGCEFLISVLCKFFCFMLLYTFQVKATACGTFVCVIRTLSKVIISKPIAIYKCFNKPRTRHTKKHCKASNGSGKFSHKLPKSKKSCYNEPNCKTGIHG